jgi:phosphoribosylformylglycinamidine cyclo-ligase
MGSNGLTSARHDILNKSHASRFPESFDNRIPDNLVYSGRLKLTDPTEIPGLDVGKMLLSPTRTYAPVMKMILEHFRNKIHGIVHCSGGGQTKILHFIDNIHVIKNNLFPVPSLFRMIREQSSASWEEMYKVFNMGHRMELYLPEKIASEVIALSGEFNIDARIIGHCESSDQRKLTIISEFGEFGYC